jgi:phosphoribosyl 1,2-cyclic phosphodiesterase
MRYGGNTSCVEVRGDDGTLIVLDCGTGAHGLGQALLAQGPRCDGHLMITHTHWDHIQGFPFFAPLFVSGNTWHIYAPGKLGHQLEQTLSGQMEYNYFPVTLAQLAASISFHDLAEGEFAIGGVRVVARYLNHPALTLGYHLESGGTSIVYSVDHEPHVPNPAARSGGEAQHKEDQRHIDFLADADLVIHDSQYTIAEYPQKTGWGHTPAQWAVDYALAAARADSRSRITIRCATTMRWTGSSSSAGGARKPPAATSRSSRRAKAKCSTSCGAGRKRRRQIGRPKRRRAKRRRRFSSPTTTPKSCGS